MLSVVTRSKGLGNQPLLPTSSLCLPHHKLWDLQNKTRVVWGTPTTACNFCTFPQSQIVSQGQASQRNLSAQLAQLCLAPGSA